MATYLITRTVILEKLVDAESDRHAEDISDELEDRDMDRESSSDSILRKAEKGTWKPCL